MAAVKKFVRRISGGLDLDTKLEYTPQDKLNDAVNVSNISDGRKKGILNPCIGASEVTDYIIQVGGASASETLGDVVFATSSGDYGCVLTTSDDGQRIWLVSEQEGKIILNRVALFSGFNITAEDSYSFSQIDNICHLIISSKSKQEVLDFPLYPNVANNIPIEGASSSSYTTATADIKAKEYAMPYVVGFSKGPSCATPGVSYYFIGGAREEGGFGQIGKLSSPIYILGNGEWDFNPIMKDEDFSKYKVRSNTLPTVMVRYKSNNTPTAPKADPINLYVLRYYNAIGLDFADYIIEKVGSTDTYSDQEEYFFVDGKNNTIPDTSDSSITLENILLNELPSVFGFAKTIHYKDGVLYAANTSSVDYSSSNSETYGKPDPSQLKKLRILQSNNKYTTMNFPKHNDDTNRKMDQFQYSCIEPKDFEQIETAGNDHYYMYQTSYNSPNNNYGASVCKDEFRMFTSNAVQPVGIDIGYCVGDMNYGDCSKIGADVSETEIKNYPLEAFDLEVGDPKTFSFGNKNLIVEKRELNTNNKKYKINDNPANVGDEIKLTEFQFRSGYPEHADNPDESALSVTINNDDTFTFKYNTYVNVSFSKEDKGTEVGIYPWSDGGAVGTINVDELPGPDNLTWTLNKITTSPDKRGNIYIESPIAPDYEFVSIDIPLGKKNYVFECILKILTGFESYTDVKLKVSVSFTSPWDEKTYNLDEIPESFDAGISFNYEEFPVSVERLYSLWIYKDSIVDANLLWSGNYENPVVLPGKYYLPGAVGEIDLEDHYFIKSFSQVKREEPQREFYLAVYKSIPSLNTPVFEGALNNTNHVGGDEPNPGNRFYRLRAIGDIGTEGFVEDSTQETPWHPQDMMIDITGGYAYGTPVNYAQENKQWDKDTYPDPWIIPSDNPAPDPQSWQCIQLLGKNIWGAIARLETTETERYVEFEVKVWIDPPSDPTWSTNPTFSQIIGCNIPPPDTDNPDISDIMANLFYPGENRVDEDGFNYSGNISIGRPTAEVTDYHIKSWSVSVAKYDLKAKHSFGDAAFCSSFKSLQHDSIYRLGIRFKYHNGEQPIWSPVFDLGKFRTPSMNLKEFKLLDTMVPFIDDDGTKSTEYLVETMFHPLYLYVNIAPHDRGVGTGILNFWTGLITDKGQPDEVQILYAKRGASDINVSSMGAISRSVPSLQKTKGTYGLIQDLYKLGDVYSLPPYPIVDEGRFWWGGQIIHPGLDYGNATYPVLDDRANPYCYNYAQGSSYLSPILAYPYQVAGDLSFNREDILRTKIMRLSEWIEGSPLQDMVNGPIPFTLVRGSAFIAMPVIVAHDNDVSDMWMYMSPETDYTDSDGNPMISSISNTDGCSISIHAFLSSFIQAGKYNHLLSCMAHPINKGFIDFMTEEGNYNQMYPKIEELNTTDWAYKYNWETNTPEKTMENYYDSSAYDWMNIDTSYMYEGIYQPKTIVPDDIVLSSDIFGLRTADSYKLAATISCNPGIIEQIITNYDADDGYSDTGIDDIQNFKDVIGTVSASQIAKSYDEINTKYMPQLRHNVWINTMNNPKILKFFINHRIFNTDKNIADYALKIKKSTFVNSRKLFSNDLLYSYLFTCSYGDRYKLAYPQEISDAAFSVESVGTERFVNMCPQWAAKTVPVHKYVAGQKIYKECINVSMADRARFNLSVINKDTYNDNNTPLSAIYLDHQKDILTDGVYMLINIPVAYQVKDAGIVALSETYYPMSVDKFYYSASGKDTKRKLFYEIEDTHEYNTSNMFSGLSYLPIDSDFLDPAEQVRQIDKQIDRKNILMSTVYVTKNAKLTTGYITDPMDFSLEFDDNGKMVSKYPLDRTMTSVESNSIIEDTEAEKALQRIYASSISDLRDLRDQYSSLDIEEPGVSLNFYELNLEDFPVSNKVYPEVVFQQYRQTVMPVNNKKSEVQPLNRKIIDGLDDLNAYTQTVISPYPELLISHEAEKEAKSDGGTFFGFYRTNFVNGPNPYGYGGNKLAFLEEEDKIIPEIESYFRGNTTSSNEGFASWDGASYEIERVESLDVHEVQNDFNFIVEAASHGASMYMATLRTPCVPFQDMSSSDVQWIPCGYQELERYQYATSTDNDPKPQYGYRGPVMGFDTYVGIHKHNYLGAFYPDFNSVGCEDAGNYNSVPVIAMFPYEGLINVDSANPMGDLDNPANVTNARISPLGGGTKYKLSSGYYEQYNDIYLYNTVFSASKGTASSTISWSDRSSDTDSYYSSNPNRVYYSTYDYGNKRFNRFNATDYIDLDPKYGSINMLFSSDDALLILQDRATAIAHPNKAQLIKTDDSVSVFMGTGGVLFASGYKYISNTYGYNHFTKQNNIAYVENSVFWVDYNTKAILEYSGGRVTNISEAYSITSWVKACCSIPDNELVVYTNRDLTVRFKFQEGPTASAWNPFDNSDRDCIELDPASKKFTSFITAPFDHSCKIGNYNIFFHGDEVYKEGVYDASFPAPRNIAPSIYTFVVPEESPETDKEFYDILIDSKYNINGTLKDLEIDIRQSFPIYENTGTEAAPIYTRIEDKEVLLGDPNFWGNYVQIPINKFEDGYYSNKIDGSDDKIAIAKGTMVDEKGIHIRYRFEEWGEDYYFDPLGYSYNFSTRFSNK